jgi:hypothetical protein
LRRYHNDDDVITYNQTRIIALHPVPQWGTGGARGGGIVYQIKRNFAESVFRKRLSLTVSLRGNEVGFLINKIFYGNCP